MKFLHNYSRYSDGTVEDNGYWLINGDRLENYNGGSTSYVPSPDDEIVEYESWAELYRHKLRNDSLITGWIAPNGEFFGCGEQDHMKMAIFYFGKKSCIELEEAGYIKVFRTPSLVRAEFPLHHNKEYDYGFREPTAAQWDTLVNKGIVEEGICP